MLLSLILLSTAPAELAAPMTMSEVRFNECVDLAIDDPASGILEANSWRIEGGGFLARHCLGFAYAEQFQWEQATTAFVEAAREAELAKYSRTANFWAQAGNAALASGKADKALEYLNAALVQGTLEGLYKGEVHLDLARAHVALNDYPAAKKELAEAHKLAPQDPLGWLLSATLARRMDDLALATSDIAVAAQLAPRDPAIALEAGNISYKAGNIENAKAHWQQAIEIDAESRPAKAAAIYLGKLEEAGQGTGEIPEAQPAPQS
ncbi:Tetratricopeptide repeat-containing protein [Parasphingorhabdus marina DSM 22363]|uniref:Tetratricopeptide repeat-containing protein n=1 Tax=Parasphingorhabdus marina DSM 22363 TaxID=1123272 RepID=A0A1N6DDM1_9SPHN|nr:tetratricopeptide repeat protein [Parasphingorhabdus marina]SIN68744.1 Tetratricopeptide repeat-containing protein [Parasphingorhabdus marina DSM 22363]